jgi:hypothetical protein
MTDRKWLPTLSFLMDLLTIAQIKQVKIPEKREEIAAEIEDLLHDINLILTKTQKREYITAEWIRDIVILSQYNLHIWQNEANIRKGVKEGNDLELTHGLNNIRNISKTKIESLVNGRKEYKKDNVQPFPEWVPSGY